MLKTNCCWNGWQSWYDKKYEVVHYSSNRLPIIGQLWSFTDFPFKWISMFLSKAYEAIEPLAFHRVIALLRTDRNRKQNSCVLVYLHFSLSRLGPLRTFFSRPRAEVTSHHQHVDRGNECHTCICSQTCNHDTPDDADNYMTIFFVLSTIDKEFFNSSRRTGLQTAWVFHVSLFLHLWYWRGYLFLGEIFFASPTSFHIVSRRPVACVCRKLQLSLLERDPMVFRRKFFSSLPIGVRKCFCSFPFISSLCANFCSEIHHSALKFCLVRELLQMHLRGEITRNCHALNTSPKTHSTVSHQHWTLSTV